MVNFDLIKKLAEVLKTEDLSSIAIDENGVKYEVKREAGIIKEVKHAAPAPQEKHHQEEKKKVEAEVKNEDDGLIAITSPMVGTFYRAPSPDSPSFVEVGDQVNVGKPVCIIEAMKLFNEIESEVSGKIVKILVENGKPVEYGQKLMLLKKE